MLAGGTSTAVRGQRAALSRSRGSPFRLEASSATLPRASPPSYRNPQIRGVNEKLQRALTDALGWLFCFGMSL